MILTRQWKNEVEDCAKSEEAEVGGFASDEVRGGGPEEPTRHVEDTQQANEANCGGRTDRTLEQVLDHRRSLFENTDSGCDVGEKDDPEEPELRRAPGILHINVVCRDQGRVF